MNQDTVHNLYDFPAREYGIQGRWPSPDPAGIGAVDPSTPQSCNRYAYVNNNPLAFTDPSGMDGEGGGSGCDEFDFGCAPNCGIFFCGGPDPRSVGPDYPVVTQMGSFGPSRFTPPGSNSIFACNPYQSCPGVYVPPGDIFQWFGFPGPCAPIPGIGNPCINDATDPGIAVAQEMQKEYEQCLSGAKKTTLGKVVDFGSLFSLVDDTKRYLKELLIGGSIKAAGGTFAKAILDEGHRHYNIITGEAPETAAEATTKALGQLGSVGIVWATLGDAGMRRACMVQAGMADPISVGRPELQ